MEKEQDEKAIFDMAGSGFLSQKESLCNKRKDIWHETANYLKTQIDHEELQEVYLNQIPYEIIAFK